MPLTLREMKFIGVIVKLSRFPPLPPMCIIEMLVGFKSTILCAQYFLLCSSSGIFFPLFSHDFLFNPFVGSLFLSLSVLRPFVLNQNKEMVNPASPHLSS